MDKNHNSKVVTFMRTGQRPPLPPGLEEISRLLHETEPLDRADESLDQVLINDAEKFYKRFGAGFKGWRPLHRRALLTLIEEKGLTDQEVRLFRYTRNLQRTMTSVRLSVDPKTTLVGAVVLVGLGAFLATLFLAFWPQLTAATARASQWAFIASLGILCFATYRFAIEPWQIERRRVRSHRGFLGLIKKSKRLPG